MHLKKTKRNGRVYLSIVQNYRENGTTKTRTIETIGYADAYAGDYDDPIAHFEARVAIMNEERRAGQSAIEFSFPPNCTIDANRTESARWGVAIALAYLDAIEAKRGIEPVARNEQQRVVCEKIEQEERVKPPHNDSSIARRSFEIFAVERMLHASPKHETWERRESFPRPCDFPIDEAYRALPLIAHADERIARSMRMAYERIRPGHAPLECAHVVLGTFAFDDTDDVDSAGNRNAESRMAVCLAMVLDEDGMPAGYRLLEADPDEHAVRSLVNDIKKSTGTRRVVMVAGRLSRAEAIMKMLAAQEDGFIMHRPLETAVEDMRHWVVDDQGYTTSRSGNYRIKSRVRAATVKAPDTSDGKEPAHAARHVHVRDIVFWGRDYALRRQGDRAEAEATTLDGYACIVTSELNLKAPEVFHLYRELWRLAEPFQVLESDFSPSPYPTPLSEHMRAHFAICYAAFFAMRLMRSDLHWRYNAAQVADSLIRMEGGYLAENWFLFGYRSPVSDAIEQAAGVDAARRLRTRQDIRKGIAQARAHIREKRLAEQTGKAEKPSGS
ncbi:hypothetical protein [Slackia sp.]|uniref:hypothetical protein n=1 Tax=Slackia sp. TaxID=2049041 RepID=UPI003A98755B